MEPEQRSLARHIPSNPSQAQLARQYDVIQRRTKRRPATRPAVWFSMAAVCAAALVLFFVLRGHGAALPQSPLEGTSVETLAVGETVLLPDGTRFVAAPHSHITLATVHGDNVRLVLDR